jgi:hypothetical protein
MNKLIILLLIATSLAVSGCAEDEAAFPTNAEPEYGCAVVVDPYGERQVCDTQYYVVNGGVVYWDAAFGLWIGPYGFWRAGEYHRGFWAAYHDHYRNFYHPHGTFHVGYSHRGGGSFRGGSFHSAAGHHR